MQQGIEFEKEVLRVVKDMGFLADSTARSADGGIDILAHRDDPPLAGRYIIQCKDWSKPVPVEVVRELYGVVTARQATEGILITTSRFTKPALEFASGKPLELIDGQQWQEMVERGTSIPVTSAVDARHNALLADFTQQLEKLKTEVDGIQEGTLYLPRRSYKKLSAYLEAARRLLGDLEDCSIPLQRLIERLEEIDRREKRFPLPVLEEVFPQVEAGLSGGRDILRRWVKIRAPEAFEAAHSVGQRVMVEWLVGGLALFSGMWVIDGKLHWGDYEAYQRHYAESKRSLDQLNECVRYSLLAWQRQE